MRHMLQSRLPAAGFGLSFAIALGALHAPAMAAESLYLPAAAPLVANTDPTQPAAPLDIDAIGNPAVAAPAAAGDASPSADPLASVAPPINALPLDLASPESDGVPLSPQVEEESTVFAGLPQPIAGNGGKFMCPFTEDGTVAAWVEKGRNAGIASNLGGTVGTLAGQKLLEQVPFFGGFLGQKVGAFSGRELAVQAAGGWAFIKKNSDQSFDDLTSMAAYVHGRYGSHPEFASVMKATTGIYPDFAAAMAAAAVAAR